MLELITIDITPTSGHNGLGAIQYNTHPRIGEWVDIDNKIFSVVMVIHSGNGGKSDIYVREICSPDNLPRYLNDLKTPYATK